MQAAKGCEGYCKVYLGREAGGRCCSRGCLSCSWCGGGGDACKTCKVKEHDYSYKPLNKFEVPKRPVCRYHRKVASPVSISATVSIHLGRVPPLGVLADSGHTGHGGDGGARAHDTPWSEEVVSCLLGAAALQGGGVGRLPLRDAVAHDGGRALPELGVVPASARCVRRVSTC